MGNRANIFATALLLMALAVWGVSALLTLRDEVMQWTIIGAMGGILALMVIKRDYSLDAKLFFFCLFGYSIGAKGFSYLGFSPLFIGEVFLGALLLFSLLRHGGAILNVFLAHPLTVFLT